MLLLLSFMFLEVQPRLQSKFPPAIDIAYPNYGYKQQVNSFRDVDFKNFKLVILGVSGTAQTSVQLKNGEYHETEDLGRTDISLGPVSFLGKEDSGPNYAILDISETDCGGSRTDTGITQVLRLERDHIVVQQQFTFDLSAPGTGTKLDKPSGILVITGRSNDDSANCCPEHVDVMRLRWNGYEFKEQSVERVALAKQKN